MDVRFTNTTSSKLSALSVVNGQLVALSDKPGLYYDLGGVRTNVTPLSISDNYITSHGTAAGRVAASSYALATAYNSLLDEYWKVSDVVSTGNMDGQAIVQQNIQLVFKLDFEPRRAIFIPQTLSWQPLLMMKHTRLHPAHLADLISI